MKTFFDGIYIRSSEHEDMEYPIKLEYYKTWDEDENVEAKYGIEIVETEFIDGKVNIENEMVKNITSNINQIDEILTVLRDKEVTPIGMLDALDEMSIKI